jgi:hypothetical protein
MPLNIYNRENYGLSLQDMFIVALSLVEFERKSHRKPIFIYIIYIINIVFYLFNPWVLLD